MPTPFYHLNVAEKLVEHPGFLPEILSLIKAHRSAFLLGHVTPDVQVISGQKRESTHFYRIPSKADDIPPWEQILNVYPSLKIVEKSDLEKAVFLAGYLCHLQADWFWVRQIFEPYFGPCSFWKSFKERLYLHNILRSYLDYQVMETLDVETGNSLAQAVPKAWLPFIEIYHLLDWQEFLIKQLKPGAPLRTVEVFASRQGISPKKYYRLLEAEDEMKDKIFKNLPSDLLISYRHNLLEKNVVMLNRYLAKFGGA